MGVEGVRVGYNKQKECNATNTSQIVGRRGPGKHIEQMNKIMGEEQMERG